jgi:tetratricopeptide (TPR) repeat protein
VPADAGVSAARSRGPSPRVRLDSWKEIAAYLKRHVTTVRRWETQEGLPVHRHLHARLGSVYAYTDELETWLKGRRPADRPPARGAAARPASAARLVLPPPPVLRAGEAPLVELLGRDTELSSLASAWDAARRGQHRLVLVTGDPGIGKTRLVFEFASSVARDATVIVGRCDDHALVPFAPFMEVLQWLVRTCPEPILRAWLRAIEGRSELAQLVPEIARIGGKGPKTGPATAEGRRYRLFEAFTGLLQALARDGPLLLAIEDIHWADRESMLLLRHLVRSGHNAAICTIVTCCETELRPGPLHLEILADLQREPSATRVALGGLSEDFARRFVSRWTGRRAAAGLTRFVMEATQGNPLFMAELLRHLSDTAMLQQAETLHGTTTFRTLGLPKTVLDVIGRRLSRLSQPCQLMLTLGAVSGREFSLSIIESLADLPEETALDAMDEAVAAKVIREVPGTPGRFSFAHALFPETLCARLTAARRVRLHHRIAEAIERLARSESAWLAELAHHYGQAAPWKDAGKAVHYAIRAGDQAAGSLALEGAARYYEMALQALDLLPQDQSVIEQRCDLHAQRGRTLFQAGQWAAAKEAFAAALALLGAGNDVKRCELLVSLSETAFWLMDVPGLRGSAAEAQRLAEMIGRDDLWANATAWLASASVADGDVLIAIESDRRAVTRAGGITSFGLARVPLTLYWAGRTHDAVQQAADAVERARRANDPAFLLYALQHSGLSLSGAGRYDEALAAFDEARLFGRRCGALPLLARAMSMSVAPLLSLGDLEGAAMRALEARELAHRVAFEAPVVSSGIDLLMIGARMHDPGRAEPLLDEIARAVEKASGWHAWKWRLRLWQARAELALARGDWNEAIIAAHHVVEQSRARSRVKYEALGLAASARARQGLGSREAAADAQAASLVARRLGDPAVLLECLTILLDVDGSDEVLDEVRHTVRRVLAAVSVEALRRRFLARWPSRIAAGL